MQSNAEKRMGTYGHTEHPFAVASLRITAGLLLLLCVAAVREDEGAGRAEAVEDMREQSNLTHIRNPDFAYGLEGWEIEPVVPGSVEPGSIDGFDRFIDRNYNGADTFILARRSREKPNAIRQKITGLEEGQLYSATMFSGDYGALRAGEEKRGRLPVSMEIEGAVPLSGPRFAYQTPFPTKRDFMGFSSEHPFWLNRHMQVFLAEGPEAVLTIRDWEQAEDPFGDIYLRPGSPDVEKVLFTHVEIQPYRDDFNDQ